MGSSGRPPADDDSNVDDGTVRARFDFSKTAPSTAVIETVAIAADCEPTALETIATAIDPDALDAIFRPTGPSTDRETTVSFPYSGYLVTIRGNGAVTVQDDTVQP